MFARAHRFGVSVWFLVFCLPSSRVAVLLVGSSRIHLRSSMYMIYTMSSIELKLSTCDGCWCVCTSSLPVNGTRLARALHQRQLRGRGSLCYSRVAAVQRELCVTNHLFEDACTLNTTFITYFHVITYSFHNQSSIYFQNFTEVE